MGGKPSVEVYFLTRHPFGIVAFQPTNKQGKSGKYTAYSDQTNITKTQGQSTALEDSLANDTNDTGGGCGWTTTFVQSRVPELTGTVRRFVQERDWEQYHTPRSLLLALLGELGELAEIFQFRSDDHDSDDNNSAVSQHDMDRVRQELADVTIYLLRLADVCRVDLSQHPASAAAALAGVPP
jgi:dCTP diphosphatase